MAYQPEPKLVASRLGNRFDAVKTMPKNYLPTVSKSQGDEKILHIRCRKPWDQCDLIEVGGFAENHGRLA